MCKNTIISKLNGINPL